MDTIKSLIKSHKMIPHPEGGHYVEVYKNKDVSHIYYLNNTFLDEKWNWFLKIGNNQ